MKTTTLAHTLTVALALAIATAAATPSFAFDAKTFWEQQSQNQR